MKRFEKLILGIESVSQAITVALMLAIMLIVFFDVVLRHLFSHPLTWAYDLIGLYLVAGVYFLNLSDSYAAHAHVGVDIVVRKLPDAGRRLSEMLTSLLGTILFGLICEAAAVRSWDAYVNREVVSGLIAWPTWVASGLAAFGSGLLVIRLAFRFVGNLLSLAQGRRVVDALPITGAHFGE